MTISKSTLALVITAGLFLCAWFLGMAIAGQPQEVQGAGAASDTPFYKVASTTVFTVTTSSAVQLLGTTTTGVGKRVAATIAPFNCATGATLFIRMQSDAPATGTNGMPIFATTTQAFAQFPELPVVTDAVRGITTVGTCSVSVTEWISTN